MKLGKQAKKKLVQEGGGERTGNESGKSRQSISRPRGAVKRGRGLEAGNYRVKEIW